jgi:DNA-binding Lrp family transcriptional regulator
MEETEREWVKRHKKVKEIVEKIVEEAPCACTPIMKVAEELKADPRTIKAHFDVMREDGVGTYLDPDEKIFCTKSGIKKLAKEMKLRIAEEEG